MFSANNFSAVSRREQVNFQYDDEVHFVLDQHAELDFYSASSLKQQSANRRVAPLFLMIGQEIGNLFIQVTTWRGLTVLTCKFRFDLDISGGYTIK